MQDKLTLALWQTVPRTGTSAALSALEAACAQAQAQDADILLTPEMAMTGYNIGRERVATLAEDANGPLAQDVARLARKYDCAVAYGYPELQDGRYYNAVQVMTADGTPSANYRKTHLFGDVDRSQFSAGETISPIFDVLGWKLALGICYDIEFPEYCRECALKQCDLLLVPTANMQPFDVVNRLLVPARAVENMMGMAYCNYVGSEAPFDYCGQSRAVDADGRSLAAGTPDDESLLIAHFTQGSLHKARALQTYLTDRRPELYTSHAREAVRS